MKTKLLLLVTILVAGIAFSTAFTFAIAAKKNGASDSKASVTLIEQEPFKGKIGETYKTSTPDFPKPI